tara:strand:- start:218 stop:559 length:342 start_codon:yes stop_codon:yes gene_type:complete
MTEQLNILILTLPTGEEVIANVKDHMETIDGVEKKVCYNMVYPFLITKSGPVRDNQVGIIFTPWKVFSADTSFLIGYDKIINMCAPLPGVVEQYKNTVDAFIKTLAGAMQQQQ